mgnify:CR=1 FL=1
MAGADLESWSELPPTPVMVNAYCQGGAERGTGTTEISVGTGRSAVKTEGSGRVRHGVHGQQITLYRVVINLIEISI